AGGWRGLEPVRGGRPGGEGAYGVFAVAGPGAPGLPPGLSCPVRGAGAGIGAVVAAAPPLPAAPPVDPPPPADPPPPPLLCAKTGAPSAAPAKRNKAIINARMASSGSSQKVKPESR